MNTKRRQRRAYLPHRNGGDTSFIAPACTGELAGSAGLAQRWSAVFGCDPPASASLIERALAWHTQVLAHGDVSAAVRRDLAAAAHQALSARTGSADPAGEVAQQELGEPEHCSAATLPPASSQLQPGTRLVKTHGGVTHVVEVTSEGMLYDGQVFASLSAVAKAITGTHWNGLLFFGLRKRKVYPAKAQAHG